MILVETGSRRMQQNWAATKMLQIRALDFPTAVSAAMEAKGKALG